MPFLGPCHPGGKPGILPGRYSTFGPSHVRFPGGYLPGTGIRCSFMPIDTEL
jgi:hypothetical protein